MANEDQLKVLLIQGVEGWNLYREELEQGHITVDLSGADLQGLELQRGDFRFANLIGARFSSSQLGGANFEGSNLRDADLRDAELEKARFTGANLAYAKLTKANLRHTVFEHACLNAAIFESALLHQSRLISADLTGADLRSCDCRNADFTGANLSGANLKSAEFGDARFDDASLDEAIIDRNTKGLTGLTAEQIKRVRIDDPGVAAPRETPDEQGFTSEELDSGQRPQEPGWEITVRIARSIVEPAHHVLQSLGIPNDIGERHRDLFDELRATVAELQERLTAIEQEDQILTEGDAVTRDSIAPAVPLWKRAWEEFVLKGAGGVGATLGKGPVFMAGFVAGMLYRTFSENALSGINV